MPHTQTHAETELQAFERLGLWLLAHEQRIWLSDPSLFEAIDSCIDDIDQLTTEL